MSATQMLLLTSKLLYSNKQIQLAIKQRHKASPLHQKNQVDMSEV